MQGYTPHSGPALGNPAAQPVQTVPNLNMPAGVNPSLTQQPAAPVTGYPPAGFPQPQGQGTYPGYFRVPGPTALGPQPGGPAAPTGTGGVAGVSMAPISSVAPPAGPGGPHPLPSLPQVPLPQGFPNPFGVQSVGQQPGPQAQAQPQQMVTGPMGYLPGLGYFPPPGGQGTSAPPPTSFPVLPGNIQEATPQQMVQHQVQPHNFQQQAQYPQQFQPQQFQPQPQAPPPAPPQAQGQNQAGANPFWLQLAWQLVQTPAVRDVLGDSAQVLIESDDRMRALEIAARCLAGPDLQGAFKALSGGQMEQTRFTELFAQQVRQALQAAGLVA